MNYVMKVCTDEYFNFLGPLKKKKKKLKKFLFSENVFFQAPWCKCPHCKADDVKLKRGYFNPYYTTLM